MIDDWTSFLTGVATVPIALWVSWAFRYGLALPRCEWEGVDWFRHAVCVSFIGIAINTLYWSVLWRGAAIVGADDLRVILSPAGGFLDFFMKGLGAWAGYCHLRSLLEHLPADERARWSSWAMPAHPASNHIIARNVNRVFARKPK